MSDDLESSSSKLSNLRAMFDKNPPKIKKPEQYQHGKGHAINNLSSANQEPINPLGKNVNPNSSTNDIFSSAEYSPTKRMSLPTQELKTWNPKARRNSDRPIFAHDQRPLNPFGKDVNPNSNATELLESRVAASMEFEAKISQADESVDNALLEEKEEEVTA